jgi:1,4-dihydroxy-2-naphthoate polyprenyltransferase
MPNRAPHPLPPDNALPARTWPRRVLAFVKLGRPIFLGGGLVMHTLGAAMALYSGVPLNLRLFVLGQVAVTATQLMTHYANDYFDVEFDRANMTPTNWSGGSRVLVDETLPPATALIAAITLALIALAAGITLAVMGRPLTLVLIMTALALAIGYSAPPVHLHTRGVGEISAAFVVAGLTPLTGFVVQSGQITALPLLGVLPLLFFQAAMLIGVAFPDTIGDASVGKRTLVVRLGERAGRAYLGVIVCAYMMLGASLLMGLPAPVGAVMLLTLPVALRQAWRVAHGAWQDTRHQDSLAFGGIALLMTAALLEVIAFLALAGT